MVITLLCSIVGLALVGLGCTSRANNLRSQQQYSYMKWVAYDTVGVMSLSFALVLTGLLAFVGLASL